eukprot:3633016-Rhodomonas_salina.7
MYDKHGGLNPANAAGYPSDIEKHVAVSISSDRVSPVPGYRIERQSRHAQPHSVLRSLRSD